MSTHHDNGENSGGHHTSDERRLESLIDGLPRLANPRGERLPVRGSRLEGELPPDNGRAREILAALDSRGIGLCARVTPHDTRSLERAVRMGRLQQELGLPVGVHASEALYGFFNGAEHTLHVDSHGRPFSDASFGSRRMGCPFRLESREADIQAQMRSVFEAYRNAKVEVSFVYFDWEIDGPIEWNGAWASSKRCRVCREHLPDLTQNFFGFQKRLRRIRSRLQRECAVDIISQYHPNALVGNYAVYPHAGIRYWYDYFETLPDGAPYIADQNARYRPWYEHEFDEAGYTFANPVIYTWYPTWSWYPEFGVDDYRWFYNMLLVVSNAGASTPSEVPLVPWVHRHTTAAPDGAEAVPQMSEWAYLELLAHTFLRGADSWMMWCPADETLSELQLLQKAYDEAGAWPQYASRGVPVIFEVPSEPGPVVSARRRGDTLLVRRTDFTDTTDAVRVRVDGRTLTVPRKEGEYQELRLGM